ncbi:hypothetical protein PHISCL_00769 [Aspergillus sclerotialis]|uniref:Altered inheritance of mitochondria protein 41 n=1 Tax=Aspergillus sclerotialis TaxID=2070753 RepID=A0A3A2ZZQ3_9EURO|nr:hypothetical protein PHISCL_00769 [Aspergillus sclerotialis]
MFNSLRITSRLPLRTLRWNSTVTGAKAPQTPPLMQTMKSDLKTAMKAKDSVRLEALRGLISEYNNSQKTSSPIISDLRLLSLIEKRIAGCKEASQQFIDANRPELKEKEDALIAVLQEYAGKVETASDDEVKAAVLGTVSALEKKGTKLKISTIMNEVLHGESNMEGKAQNGQIAKIAKEILTQKNL